jgi:hypothetical protein
MIMITQITNSEEAVRRERQMWINAIKIVLANPVDLARIGSEDNDVRRALEPIAELKARMNGLEK